MYQQEGDFFMSKGKDKNRGNSGKPSGREVIDTTAVVNHIKSMVTRDYRKNEANLRCALSLLKDNETASNMLKELKRKTPNTQRLRELAEKL